jgi:abhydrolase domain-containing protein 2
MHRYRPPRLWGRSGHLQTAFYGILGHASLRRTYDKRHAVRLPDGTTVTFDVFEPAHEHADGRGDYTLALCPGIASTSESNYIRTCVHYAQDRGYRCAVLNHLGVANVPLTTSRVFTYGQSFDYFLYLPVVL